MTSTLTQQLHQEQDAARERALAEYRVLVSRADNPEPGDVEQLRDIAAQLAISVSDVESDIGALRDAAQLRQQFTPPEKLAELQRALADEQAAVLAEVRADLCRMVNSLELIIAQRLHRSFIGGPSFPLSTPAFAENESRLKSWASRLTDVDLSLHCARRENQAAAAQLRRLAADHPRVLPTE